MTPYVVIGAVLLVLMAVSTYAYRKYQETKNYDWFLMAMFVWYLEMQARAARDQAKNKDPQ